MERNIAYLSVQDRTRLLEEGAVVSEIYDRAIRLFRYVLPNGKIFAEEELDNGKVVLRETSNSLLRRKSLRHTFRNIT